jgi:hypothetical protein
MEFVGRASVHNSLVSTIFKPRLVRRNYDRIMSQIVATLKVFAQLMRMVLFVSLREHHCLMALALAVQAIGLRQNAAIPPQHPKQSHTNLHRHAHVLLPRAVDRTERE